MKKLVSLLVVLGLSITVGFSQTNQSHKADIINVKTDLGNLRGSLVALNCDSAHGDAQHLQDILNYNHVTRSDAQLHLYFPVGNKVKIDSVVYPYSNVTIEGGNFICTSFLGTRKNMFEIEGYSNITFINCTFTNWFASFINAFVQNKAQPYVSKNNTIQNCTIRNSWGANGFEGANVNNGDSTYYLDGFSLINDTIINFFNPSKPAITSYSDYFTNVMCNGVNLLNGCRSCTVDGLYAYNIGGDAVFGYGLGAAMTRNLRNGHIEIKNCRMYKFNMGVEITGNWYNNGISVHDNEFWWSQCFFDLSLASVGLQVYNNKCYNADGTNMELASVGGDIHDNQCYIYTWKDTSMGVQKPAPNPDNNQCHNVEAYGFNNKYHDNIFRVDPTHPSSTSSAEFNGIAIVAPALSPVDSIYNQNSWNGYSTYSTGWTIDHNTFIGQTNKVLDITNNPVAQVKFTNNYISTRNHKGTDDLCMIWGYDFTFSGNYFDMTGSAVPINGHALIKERSQQSSLGNSRTVVQNNTVKGSAWYARGSHYIWIQK